MVEVFRNFKSFVEEKRNLQEQINHIEEKRNELAKERNAKIAFSKNNNDEEILSEINCLSKQISDLGNQSQWFQNQINKKLNIIKEQSYIEIDSFIAEEIRKIRIINEQIEENKNNSENIITTDEEKNSIQEIQKCISNFLTLKKIIKYGDIYKIINNVITEEDEIVEKVEETTSNVQEIKTEEIEPKIEPLIVENFEPQLDEIKIDELEIEPLEEIEELSIEDIIVEEFEKIQKSETTTENTTKPSIDEIKTSKENTTQQNKEETKTVEENTSTQTKEILNIEDEIIKTLQEQLAREKEIITFEENNQLQETINNIQNATLQSIIVKVENKDIIYKAQISDGTTINFYPAKEGAFKNYKILRTKWKETLIRFAATTYQNFSNDTIRKMDPNICEVIEQYAKKYDKDFLNLIYNYIMSFSREEQVNSEILPKISYNLAYFNNTETDKNTIKIIQRTVKNASRNLLIETIGKITLDEKIKYFIKRLFNINKVKTLTAGNKENNL